MAVLTDRNGAVWTVSRRWWPFPGDALDLTFGVFELILGAVFLLLWPLWVLAKFCGVRWVITVERNGHQVGRELVRGYGKSGRRVNEILADVASGGRSGHVVI